MSPGHWSPVQDPQAGVQSLVLGFQDSETINLCYFRRSAHGTFITMTTLENQCAGSYTGMAFRAQSHRLSTLEHSGGHPSNCWSPPSRSPEKTMTLQGSQPRGGGLEQPWERLRLAVSSARPRRGDSSEAGGGTLLPGWFGLRAQGRGA